MEAQAKFDIPTVQLIFPRNVIQAKITFAFKYNKNK